jgi:hypothetical protein
MLLFQIAGDLNNSAKYLTYEQLAACMDYVEHPLRNPPAPEHGERLLTPGLRYVL